MTKLLSSFVFLIAVIVIAACSNSSPVSNFKAPPKFEPVDRPIMVQDGEIFRAGAIRISSSNVASIEILTESKIDKFAPVNVDLTLTKITDDESSNDNTDQKTLRESGLPEYLVFTETGKPFDIFVYDYINGISTAIFDLQSENLIRSDERVCTLNTASRVSSESLDEELIYSFNSFGIYFSAAKDCEGSWDQRNFYELEFVEDADSGTLVELPPTDPEVSTESNIVTVLDISATRQSAPEALSNGGIIITSRGIAGDSQYGILGYSYQQQALQFFLPLNANSTTVELAWSVPFNAKQTFEGEALFPEFVLASDNSNEPIIIQYADDLYRLNKELIFDLGLQSARIESFSTPLIELNDTTNQLGLVFDKDENAIVFRDGNFIKSVDVQGTLLVEKNIIDDLNIEDFSFSKENNGLTIYKHFSSGEKAVTYISTTNIEVTLEAAGVIPRFASKARLYEYIKQDAAGDYSRTVQSFFDGSNSGLGNENSTFTSAIDLRKIYPGNSAPQTALLSGDIRSKNAEQLIINGALYVYDDLGLEGNRTFLGRLDTGIKSVISVRIQTDTYGSLVAETENGVRTFFFNPQLAKDDSNYAIQLL
jgi:hypothetical protein